MYKTYYTVISNQKEKLAFHAVKAEKKHFLCCIIYQILQCVHVKTVPVLYSY